MLDRLNEWKDEISQKVANLMGDGKPKGMTSTPTNQILKTLFDRDFLSGLLPYQTYDTETGLFLNKKSQGFMLEVSTLLGSSEEIENILSSIVTDILPAGMDMQFLLWASPKVGHMMDAFEQERSNDQIAAWLAKKRTDYLKKGAFESLSGLGSFLVRDFRLFLIISSHKKRDVGQARLVGLRDDIESSLKSINMGSRRLDAEQFIHVLSDLITPSMTLYPDQKRWNEYDSLSWQITNPEWQLRILPDSLTFTSEHETVDTRCLTVREYPETTTQWKVTENIGQLFNATLQIPCPFLVSFSLQKIDQEKSLTQSQLTFMNRESNANSPLARFKPSVSKEYEEWKFIRNRLSEGDSLVKTFYSVILFSKPEKANECERRIRDLYRANGWKLRKESYLQLQTWLASLPMLMSEGLFTDLKFFGRLRTMTAFNAVNVAPLQGEWKGTKSPSLILPGRRGQMAIWNPFDNEAGNYNIAIIAAPGKGKSALTQEYVQAILGQNGRVWVIDAGRSYEKTCKIQGGQFIEFTKDTHICLNPFTTIQDINESMEMLKPLIAGMARPVSGATEEELSCIEQAVQSAWLQDGNKATISTVAKCLTEQQKPIAMNLSHLLYSFTKEGSYARFFEGDCSIDFSNKFIVMELQELKAKKDLKRIVLQLLIYLISQEMYLTGRQQIKSCIIDEAWDLFDDDNLATAKFIEAGYRQARKFRGNFVTISHSIADFHRNPMSRAAYDCADFKIILGQTDEAINKLKQEKIMDMDGFTERLFKSLKLTKEYSECVIKSPDGLSVHRIIFDPYSRILYSTKGEEFDAVDKLVNQGVPLIDAIQQVAREYHHV